jgi:hypothetical protein
MNENASLQRGENWTQIDGAPNGDEQAAAESDFRAFALEHDVPDVNQKYFIEQWPDHMPPVKRSTVPGTISDPSDVIDRAIELLKLLFAEPDFRLRYYNIARSWHNRSQGTGGNGGDYEQQWLTLLSDAKVGAGLNTNDFANIHRVMFLTLWRTMLTITGRDVHGNVDELPHDGMPAFRSFHWVPNDTSAPLGTFNRGTELGFPPDQP